MHHKDDMASAEHPNVVCLWHLFAIDVFAQLSRVRLAVQRGAHIIWEQPLTSLMFCYRPVKRAVQKLTEYCGGHFVLTWYTYLI